MNYYLKNVSLSTPFMVLTFQTDVCTIGRICMKDGETSIYDDCKYCSLENPTQWTIRTGLYLFPFLDDPPSYLVLCHIFSKLIRTKTFYHFYLKEKENMNIL